MDTFKIIKSQLIRETLTLTIARLFALNFMMSNYRVLAILFSFMGGVGTYDVFWDETTPQYLCCVFEKKRFYSQNASLQTEQWDKILSREGMKYSGLLSPCSLNRQERTASWATRLEHKRFPRLKSDFTSLVRS